MKNDYISMIGDPAAVAAERHSRFGAAERKTATLLALFLYTCSHEKI